MNTYYELCFMLHYWKYVGKSASKAEVKSEFVVPIFKNGQVIGELDIESHQLAAFTPADQAFLDKVAARVSEIL
jgi:GAF domain-containing protein